MASYYGFVVFAVDFIIHAVIVGGFFWPLKARI